MKHCKICGKDISHRVNNSVRYCEACTDVSRQQYYNEEYPVLIQCRKRTKEVNARMSALYADVKAAEELGMSYGQYAAMKAKADRCVACGEIIPEGRQVCPRCEKEGSV